jgi:hypothetical protein
MIQEERGKGIGEVTEENIACNTKCCEKERSQSFFFSFAKFT